MQIIWNVNTLPPSTTSVVSLGTFDGVHLGHQTILDEVKKRAHKLHSKATMVTFEPHPQLVLNNPSRPPHEVLTTIEEKSRSSISSASTGWWWPTFRTSLPDWSLNV